MHKDGVDHINVYSKGQTELGRLLSNFAQTPFELEVETTVHYPKTLRFASVEAWWYWRKAKAHGVDEKAHLDELRTLYGLEAKRYGQDLTRSAPPSDPTRQELLRVYQAKVACNPRIAAMLRKNKLPFDHYYVYNGRRQDTHHRWTGLLWNEVKP